MTSAQAYEFGKLVGEVHLTSRQRQRILSAIPFMSEKKIMGLYRELKSIRKAEKAVEANIIKMKRDFESGKIKID